MNAVPATGRRLNAFCAVAMCASGIGLGACGDDPAQAGDGGSAMTLEELVNAYEDGDIDRDEFRSALHDYPDSELPNQLAGEIAATTLLEPRSEPWRITGNLSVAEGAILVIQAGNEIIIDPGVNLDVSGRLYAVGSEEETVLIRGEGDRYGAVILRSGPNQLVWVELDRGERNLAVTHPFETHTLVESARFDSWGDIAVDQVASSGLHILRSSFGFATAEADVSGETVRTRNSGVIVIEESSFNYRRGYRDVLDLQDCVEGLWPVIIHNRFDGGEDDAVDLDACSAFVVGNRITNFRPLDLDNPYGGVNGGGVTGDGPASKPFIANNIIDGCFHGIGFKNGAEPVIVNNTIINSNIGITLYQADPTQPQPHGLLINNVLDNNVGWLDEQANDIVLNGKWWPTYNQVDDIQATVDATYNITATLPAPYTGEGNLNDDPGFAVVDGIPIPDTGSPAIDSGQGELSFTDQPMEAVREYLQTDYLGNPRDYAAGVFAAIDRGAVEAAD